jgi:short-subunit dehydrogenase
MVTVMSRIADSTAEDCRRVTEVTYLGVVHGTLSALPRMRARDRGTIVQVGSALAYRSIPLQSAYCAAKAAIRGFTDSLRVELSGVGDGRSQEDHSAATGGVPPRPGAVRTGPSRATPG